MIYDLLNVKLHLPELQSDDSQKGKEKKTNLEFKLDKYETTRCFVGIVKHCTIFFVIYKNCKQAKINTTEHR